MPAHVVPGVSPEALAGRSASVVGICASTGGPRAIHELLLELPADYAIPILVVQHIADGFLDAFVKWLGRSISLPVRVATAGIGLQPGVTFAADGAHLLLDVTGRLVLDRHLEAGPHRPSGDVLLRSLAARWGGGAAAVVLTGLGRDGAGGLRAVAEAGGVTVAQDADSSVVFGMPKVAAEQGAELVLSPAQIGVALNKLSMRGATR